MKIRTLLLAGAVVLSVLCALQSRAQMKVDEIHFLVATDTVTQGPSTVDQNGDVYTIGTFNGSMTCGTTTITSPVGTRSMYLKKMDSHNCGIWLKKLTINNPLVEDAYAKKIAYRNGRVYVLGSLVDVQTAYSYGYFSVVNATDGADIGVWDNTTLTFVGVDADSADNVYLSGGYITSAGQGTGSFITRLSATGNQDWVYYLPETDTTRMIDLKYKAGVVSIVGEYQTKLVIADSFATTPIVFTPTIPQTSRFFTASYSRDGKLLSANEAQPGPGLATGVPTYLNVPIAFSYNGNFQTVWAIADSWGDIKVYSRKLGKGFTSATSGAVISQPGCSFKPDLVLSQSEYCGNGVLTTLGLMCGYQHFGIDSTGKIVDTLTIPSTADYWGFYNVYYTFDSCGSRYVSATFKGSFSYRDSSGLKSFSSGGKYVGYVAKLHTCKSREVNITKRTDSLWTDSVPGLKYQWYKDGSPVFGQTNPWIVPASSGTYTVVVTDGWLCSSASTGTYVTVGIDELTLNRISLYPNPVTSTVTIEGLPENTSGYITDIMGKTVLVAQLKTGVSNHVDLANLPTGIYMLKLPYGTKKLVKQ